jgi:threonine dehydratase
MVKQAAARLNGVAVKTPVLTNNAINKRFGAEMFFKCETFQRTGAFKFRGAYNCMKAFQEEGDVPGVIAYSSGNHAQAVALTGRLLGIKNIILMPKDAPEKKVKATKDYGGTVILYDRFKDDREAMAKEL